MTPTRRSQETAQAVGRPRLFDPEEVLAAALELFWRQGYEATSLEDLTRATGLSRSSFYACYGSKRGMLIAALEHYAAGSLAALGEIAAEAAAPRGALRAMIEAIAAPDGGRHGCLMVNCITELAPQDAEIAVIGAEHIARVEAAFAAQMPDLDPAEAATRARALVALAVGAITLRKAGYARDRIGPVLAAAEALMPEARAATG